MLKDNILINNKYQDLGVHCYACNRVNHDIMKCPFITYRPDKDAIVRRFTLDRKQKRENFERKKRNWSNTLYIREFIEKETQRWLDVEGANQKRLLNGMTSRSRKTISEDSRSANLRKASFNSVDFDNFSMETEGDRDRSGSVTSQALSFAMKKFNMEPSPAHRSKFSSIYKRESLSGIEPSPAHRSKIPSTFKRNESFSSRVNRIKVKKSEINYFYN